MSSAMELELQVFLTFPENRFKSPAGAINALTSSHCPSFTTQPCTLVISWFLATVPSGTFQRITMHLLGTNYVVQSPRFSQSANGTCPIPPPALATS